jgi:DNA-binding transcriptional regulator YiaG
MNLSKRLKAWRGVKGKGRSARGEFSQAEAARRLGVPPKTYLDWEQARRVPRGFALQALLERIK